MPFNAKHRSPEFELIERYFYRPPRQTLLGIGDDAALIEVSAGHVLAVSSDTLIEHRHFFADVDPYRLGHKALAVNLSDMAAMGALPRWFTLSLSLPEVDHPWLKYFTQGLFDLADRFQVELIGGDTTKGPLAINIQILGELMAARALKRSGAKVGDEIWVSGRVGGAALAVAWKNQEIQLEPQVADQCLIDLDMPEPRVGLGNALSLRGLASSAIDISDGLLADLGHILERSDVGAKVYWDKIPMHPLAQNEIRYFSGGDDYELCFTAAPDKQAQILALGEELFLPVTCIGQITEEKEYLLYTSQNIPIDLSETATGFDHFDK